MRIHLHSEEQFVLPSNVSFEVGNPDYDLPDVSLKNQWIRIMTTYVCFIIYIYIYMFFFYIYFFN